MIPQGSRIFVVLGMAVNRVEFLYLLLINTPDGDNVLDRQKFEIVNLKVRVGVLKDADVDV